MKTVEEIVSVLTEEQKQVLKDTILHGYWGDCNMEFLKENSSDEEECVLCDGYCTNDAKLAGNFQGRKIAGLFRGIYNRMCPRKYGKSSLGEVICHCSNWWGDGTGDMLFIRSEYSQAFEEWAKQG